MTRYKAIARRLARLEQDHRAWVESLSDDELDALLATIPPDERTAFEAMTDAEYERMMAGRMTHSEWWSHLERARRTISGT